MYFFLPFADRYFKFGEAGDCYIARRVLGLSPSNKEFTILPPMFKDCTVEQGQRIDEAVNQIFAGCLRCPGADTPSFRSVLRMCLACMIHQREYLMENVPCMRSSNFLSVIQEQNLVELVFFGYEGDVDCPSGAKTRGVPPILEATAGIRKHVDAKVRFTSALWPLFATFEYIYSIISQLSDFRKEVQEKFDEQAAQLTQLQQSMNEIKHIIVNNRQAVNTSEQTLLTHLSKQVDEIRQVCALVVVH